MQLRRKTGGLQEFRQQKELPVPEAALKMFSRQASRGAVFKKGHLSFHVWRRRNEITDNPHLYSSDPEASVFLFFENSQSESSGQRLFAKFCASEGEQTHTHRRENAWLIFERIPARTQLSNDCLEDVDQEVRCVANLYQRTPLQVAAWLAP